MGPPRVAHARPVAMPPRALHVLDAEADVLVYAEAGSLAIVRGLVCGERLQEHVALPRALEVRGLAMGEGVVYVGGRGGCETMGLVDLVGEPRFVATCGHGQDIDGLVARDGRLISVAGGAGWLWIHDVTDPRTPRLVTANALVPLVTPEKTVAVAVGARAMAMLSTSTNEGIPLFHVRVLDLVTLQQRAILTEQRRHTLGSDAQACEVSGLALAGDLLLLAAGERGIGVLDLAPWITGSVREDFVHCVDVKDPFRPPKEPLPIPPKLLRFVEVSAGRVVDVVAASAAAAFAVIAGERGELDAVLVPIAPAPPHHRGVEHT